MAIDFPNSPAVDDYFSVDGKAYIFNGVSWGAVFAPSASVIIGPEGPAGPEGLIGATGPEGPAGVDGSDGNDGIDGADGADGIDGADGTNGTNGTNGADGAGSVKYVFARNADPVASGQMNFNQVYFPYVTEIKLHTYSKNGTIQNLWVNQWQVGSKLLISNSAGDVAMFTITSAPDLNGAIYTVGVANFNAWDSARYLELSFGLGAGDTSFTEDVSIVHFPIPRTYVTKYTDAVNDTQWTCPDGVTQIKLTLIGAGGAAGDVTAITSGTTSSNTFPGDTAASTTFTVGATVYTALGGKKGMNVSVTGASFSGGGYYYNSAMNTSSGTTTTAAFTRYPGCGGAPGFADASTGLTYSDAAGELYPITHTSKAYAHGNPGRDGVIEVFQVTVIPSTTYSFVIGKAAGFVSPTFTTETYMGSNGGVIIEYIV